MRILPSTAERAVGGGREVRASCAVIILPSTAERTVGQGGRRGTPRGQLEHRRRQQDIMKSNHAFVSLLSMVLLFWLSLLLLLLLS